MTVVNSPAIMPAEAPHLLARFQKMPITSTGKKVDAANENAAATRNRISAGVRVAAQAAAKATISKLDIAGDRSKLDEYLGAPSDSILDAITVNWMDHEEAGIHAVTFTTESGAVTIE